MISPLLFALSFHLLVIILNFVGRLAGASTSALPFSISAVTVDPESFRYFSISAIATIAFFSSLIVSIVEKGNVKSGLKYIPIFMIGSLALYFAFMKILGFVFSGIVV